MTKIQNSKQAFVFEYWNVRFICNLVLGICGFIDSTTPLIQRTAARVKTIGPPSGGG
jgi:hypothetical protein